MLDLITKKPDGSYGLTEAGLSQAHSITMRNLIQHYMQKGLKADAATIQATVQKLPAFIDANIKTFDDYLDKMPQFAQLIGESNSGRFATFIGQHFIPTSEKIEKQLYDRELPKAKDKFENPYRSPGNEVLDHFAAHFAKARALVWPPEKGSSGAAQTEQKEATIQELSQPKDQRAPGEIVLAQFGPLFASAQALDTEAVGHSSVKAQAEEENQSMAQIAPALAKSDKLPGEELLGQFGSAFVSAQPLNQEDIGHSKVQAQAEAENQSVAQLAPALAKSDVLPGENVLVRFASEFAAAPALKAESDGKETPTPGASQATTVPQQTLLKEYAQLMGAVSKFTKAKDNAGYQAWYQNLASKYKTVLNINNLLTREQKGQPVDYNEQLANMAHKLLLDFNVVQKIHQEVKSYRKILVQIQRALQKAAAASSQPASIQKLYGQLVSLFENKDTIDSKKTALKMALLQVTEAGPKQSLQTDLSSLLDTLAELYNM